MKFNIYIVMALMVCVVSQGTWAQDSGRQIATEQEYIRCYSMEADQEMRAQHPELGTLDEFEERMASLVEAYRESVRNGEQRRVVYTIPIIFHIIHNGENVSTGSNINSIYIQAQLDQLNNDFRKVVGTSGDNDDPVGVDSEIEFCLALRDPEGNILAEPGVNRINRNDEGWTNPPFTTGYIQNNVKAATVWDSEKYLNVWSANISGGILGYAQFPNNTGLPGLNANNGTAATDGVVILYTSMGSTETAYPGGAPYNMGRTLTHELGHYFGLRHIWGDSNCGDDYCDDTPTQQSSSGGNCPNTFTCGSTDMTTNYMDYSNDVCMNIYTFNQKERMQAVMAGVRNGLNNSAAIVCDPDASYAAFAASTYSGCEGSSILFIDNSVGDNFVSWSWDFGDGIGTSSDQNPTYTYVTAGEFTVTLTVNDGAEDFVATRDVVISTSGTFDHLNGGTLWNELAANEGGSSGYVGGHNSFGDNAKAEYFEEGADGAKLGEVEITFAVATSPPGINVRCVVWDDAGGSPGDEIAAVNVAINSLSTDGSATVVDFGEPTLNGPFYVGVELDYGNSSDVSIFTNHDGDTDPVTAWERWSDDTWHSFNDGTETTWQWDVALAISAEILCEETQAPVAPVAGFTADATTVCAGVEVNFTDQSTNDPTAWSWNFGDGSTSSSANPSHSYASAGDYTVVLTASNTGGSDSETKVDYISVEPAPVGFAGLVSTDEICDGESVDLSMTGTFSASYSWEGPGGVIANSSTTTVTPGTTTTYTAICDDGICRAESDVTITVNALPGTPTISNGGGGALSASSSSSGSWQWYLDGNAISGATNSTFTATVEGDYQAEITDNDGCVSISASEAVVLSAVLDEALNAAIDLYPNPVSDKLTIAFNNYPYANLSLTLIDVAGRELHTMRVDNAIMEIDMQTYSEGVYLLKLETGEGRMAIRKIVKQQ